MTTVYPRWRGEHVVIPAMIGEEYGLSPLARGTRRLKAPQQMRLRFIPAGAGNTVC